MAYPYKDFNLGELKSLVNFKYACIDNSLLHRYAIKALFTRIQKYIPPTVHPNKITLFGFGAMFASFVATYLLDPTLTNPPHVLILANLAAMALYFVADGVDGIHARATRRTSPLGYLLDHGVDSCVCLFSVVGISSTLGIGMGRLFLLFLMNVYANFYFGVLHHKYAGVFVFNYISGCSEGIVAAILIHAATLFTPALQLGTRGKLVLFSRTITQDHIASLLLCSLVYGLLELSHGVLPRLEKQEYPKFLSSIYNIAMPLGIFTSAFLSGKLADAAQRWMLLSILACCFTLCYIEETLSVMLKCNADPLAFIYADVLLAACFTAVNCNCDTAYFLKAILACSLAASLLRVVSLIRNFCKRTGHAFIS